MTITQTSSTIAETIGNFINSFLVGLFGFKINILLTLIGIVLPFFFEKIFKNNFFINLIE